MCLKLFCIAVGVKEEHKGQHSESLEIPLGLQIGKMNALQLGLAPSTYEKFKLFSNQC